MFSDKCVNNTYICNPEANILSCSINMLLPIYLFLLENIYMRVEC